MHQKLKVTWKNIHVAFSSRTPCLRLHSVHRPTCWLFNDTCSVNKAWISLTWSTLAIYVDFIQVSCCIHALTQERACITLYQCPWCNVFCLCIFSQTAPLSAYTFYPHCWKVGGFMQFTAWRGVCYYAERAVRNVDLLTLIFCCQYNCEKGHDWPSASYLMFFPRAAV